MSMDGYKNTLLLGNISSNNDCINILVISLVFKEKRSMKNSYLLYCKMPFAPLLFVFFPPPFYITT